MVGVTSLLRLDLLLVVVADQGRRLVDKLGEIAAQLVNVGAAGLEDLDDGGDFEQGQQQMLHGHKLVATVPRAAESLVKTEFQFAA